MELHEILNARRKELGLQYEDLQEKSGISKSTLLKVFTGVTKDPQLSTLRSIANVLGYTLDDIAYLQDETPVLYPNLSEDAYQFAQEFDRLDSWSRELLWSTLKHLLQKHLK